MARLVRALGVAALATMVSCQLIGGIEEFHLTGVPEGGLDASLSPDGAQDASGATASDAAGSVAPPVIIGEPSVLTIDDYGNANMLLAQQTTLGQPATIQSLSFYVATASGKLRLGIYDATGPGGGPGTKKAETAELTAALGWNAANVITPVLLPAANYWLAYTTNDNNLHFELAAGVGNIAYYSVAYGPMPTTFSTAPTTGAYHWSFYGTLTP